MNATVKIPDELMKLKYDTFVLDTSVVMNFPHEIEEMIRYFSEHGKKVIILSAVYDELDNISKIGGERGYLAREARNCLNRVRGSEAYVYLDMSEYVERDKHHDMSLILPKGEIDTKYIVWSGKRFKKEGHYDVDETLKYLAYMYPVCVITNDKRIITDIENKEWGNAKGSVYDFRIDGKELYTGFIRLDREDTLLIKENGDKALDYLVEKYGAVYPNQFFFGENEIFVNDKGLKRIDEEVERYFFSTFKLKNEEQKAAAYLLMNPKIKLVYLFGPAGTGKTLLSLLSGMFQLKTPENPNGIYENILILMGTQPVERDIGYLPGNKRKKLGPWAEKIMDNFEVIKKYNKKSKIFKIKKIEEILEKGFEAVTYIRGRSIPYTFIIWDEAQNHAPPTAKTVITRVGDGSKIVIIGDPSQIDNKYLSEGNNGLVVSLKRLMGNSPDEFPEFMGVVKMTKNERSQVSKLAAERL